METLFTLPLFLLLSVQTFISILLLLPKAVSLPVAGLLKNLRKNTATASVIYTIVGAFALLSVASIMEVMRGAERVRASGLRGEVLGTVDFLRSQVSAVLAVSNLLFLLLNVALSEKACELDHTCKNFEAFKRQTKGLQAAYESATAEKPAADGVDSSEAVALKKQVDKLIQDKQRLEAEVEAANKAAKSAEANVEAMKKQIKGLDTEYDRMLAENTALKQKYGEGKPINKKDD